MCLAACTSEPADQSSTTLPGAPTTTSTDTSVTTTTVISSQTTDPPETTTTIPLSELELVVTQVADGFDAPVLLVADPDGGPDLVVEQPGRVVRLDGARTVVADIRNDVVYGGERGLLGLAFHPEYATNRLVYVNYTGRGGSTVIEQFEVGPDGSFDTATRQEILTVPQPARNHNGGMIAFGPDGYLWIGMGDGGGSDDRFGNGQRSDTLLGSMLRIGVGSDDANGYLIPPDNPFADGGSGAPEVWAIGLRNPWRFTFDGDDVWIADVGQNRVEEVDLVDAGEPGLNFGWPVMEGSTCFEANSCDIGGFVVPLTDYTHDEGCSITGGVVSASKSIPTLDGHYFFSDYCSGFLRSIEPGGAVIDWSSDGIGTIPRVSGFGTGGDTETYIVSHDGVVYRIEVAR